MLTGMQVQVLEVRTPSAATLETRKRIREKSAASGRKDFSFDLTGDDDVVDAAAAASCLPSAASTGMPHRPTIKVPQVLMWTANCQCLSLWRTNGGLGGYS